MIRALDNGYILFLILHTFALLHLLDMQIVIEDVIRPQVQSCIAECKAVLQASRISSFRAAAEDWSRLFFDQYKGGNTETAFVRQSMHEATMALRRIPFDANWNEAEYFEQWKQKVIDQHNQP
jgi:hypothetical protein